MPNRDKLPRGPFLEETVTVPVRFHEVDVMRVVWHGWYCAYFEDARVALGRRFGVSYEAIAGQGFMAPIVRLQCEFCAPARYGDVLSVTARLYPREAAKLEFGYLVHRSSDARLLAIGQSLQVLTDMNGELVLAQPQFLRDLRSQWASQVRSDEP